MAFEDLELHFVIDDPGFARDTFRVLEFSGEERISQCFRFDVHVVSAEAALSLADVADKPATLEVYRGGEMLIFHGQVVHFEQGVHVGDTYAYRAVLMPWLWYLSFTFQSRIFRDMTAPEVLEHVLQEAGLTSQHYRLDLGETYPRREYIVQYNEDDLAFLSRLAEHNGIYYYFDEGVAVFSDGLAGPPPPIAGVDALVFNPGGGLEAAAEAVREFICQERLVTGKVLLKDYNYRTPETLLESESQINAEMPGTRYEYGQHFPDVGEGDRLARVRNQEIECQRRVMHGESSFVGMHAGFTFKLAQHFRDDFNGEYLLTALQHGGTQAGAVLGGGGDTQQQRSYSNRFECIPAEVPYRPPRVTKVPRIPGIMTGRLEKPGGDYAHLDEEGRYRARMHFDRGSAAQAEATHPIRMKQPYSGPNYGVHFPNHAETEMVWACIDGNPDRPMALGTSPNPTQKSPSTSQNKWQSVIRTWGRNELTFDDKVGEENIYMHATKDHTVVVTNNESISVGNDQSISVGHDRTKSVGNDEKNTIQNNRTTDIQDGDETLTVHTGDRTVNVNTGDDTHNVLTGDRTVNVSTGDDTHNVKTGDRAVNVNTGDDTLNVLTGKKTDTIKGPYEITVNSAHVKIVCGSSELTMGHDGTITLSGVKISIIGSEEIKASAPKVEITGTQEVKAGVGTQNITLNTAKVETGGAGITTAAVGVHEITGALVKIN